MDDICGCCTNCTLPAWNRGILLFMIVANCFFVVFDIINGIYDGLYIYIPSIGIFSYGYYAWQHHRLVIHGAQSLRNWGIVCAILAAAFFTFGIIIISTDKGGNDWGSTTLFFAVLTSFLAASAVYQSRLLVQANDDNNNDSAVGGSVQVQIGSTMSPTLSRYEKPTIVDIEPAITATTAATATSTGGINRTDAILSKRCTATGTIIVTSNHDANNNNNNGGDENDDNGENNDND